MLQNALETRFPLLWGYVMVDGSWKIYSKFFKDIIGNPFQSRPFLAILAPFSFISYSNIFFSIIKLKCCLI